MVGALLAFLWYNSHPAQLFMGRHRFARTRCNLAVVALMTGQWLLLPIVGLVFVAEALSDVLQVSWYKWTKKRTGGQAHFPDGAFAPSL
jgi:phospho-N-acetylmuramoyl-pentapeptide-transferase